RTHRPLRGDDEQGQPHRGGGRNRGRGAAGACGASRSVARRGSAHVRGRRVGRPARGRADPPRQHGSGDDPERGRLDPAHRTGAIAAPRLDRGFGWRLAGDDPRQGASGRGCHLGRRAHAFGAGARSIARAGTRGAGTLVSLLDLDRGAVLSCCDSTQPLCVALAEAGAPEGTVVWSWEQTRGQGRGANSWISPPDAGLWMSFLLRPPVPLEEWPAFTALVAVAAGEAIELLVGGTAPPPAPDHPVSKPVVLIKWPNDLHGRRGKLGGVLAQSVHGG